MDSSPSNVTSLQVVRYEAGRQRAWDDFVAGAKNGVFLFLRDYMDYHADRFTDSSLMFYDARGELVALLPASRREQVLTSHAGLTFGGIIADERMKVGLMLDVFLAMMTWLRAEGFRQLVYKAIPHIYHRLPAEEDLYALFRNGAQLWRRDVSTTIQMSTPLNFSKGRRWALKQSEKAGLDVRRSFDFEAFMSIEGKLLADKYAAQPVHTAAELKLLADRFPDNIKLFAAYDSDSMVAGVIIYESSEVAHAQYIGATEEGRASGASDLIMDYLISSYYTTKRYFDFGISTEKDGHYLNKGLIENKQGFGGRAITYDSYDLQL